MKRNNSFYSMYAVITSVFFILTITGNTALAEQYIYTTDSLPSGNGIHAYRIKDNGNLEELADSPYATGGRGIGASPVNQNGVVIDSSKRLLLTVNTASDDVSVFHILPHGSLRPVHGSPFKTGGAFPVSIAISDDVVYIAHFGPGGLNTPRGGPCTGCGVFGLRLSKAVVSLRFRGPYT